ncbi:MAG: PQQ-binding-like beta-propeller repeat protein, partial [Verrucomicrobiota bacterium]
MKRIRFFLFCAMFPLLSPAQEADWAQWRGVDRKGHSPDTGLLKSWPEGGPEQVWIFKDAGEGYAGPSIVEGKFFTMGARDGQAFVLCLDANTGKKQWEQPVGEKLKNRWGDGPRSTPTVDGDHLYALGGKGTLVCLKTADGSRVWEAKMESFGGKVPGWGYTESVLIDGDQVVCTPGGEKGTLLALNKKTGEKIWQSSEFTDGAQYASIVVGEHKGVRQYVQLTQKHFVGVDASNGKVRWTSEWPGKTAVIPTPIFENGHVYITA